MTQLQWSEIEFSCYVNGKEAQETELVPQFLSLSPFINSTVNISLMMQWNDSGGASQRSWLEDSDGKWVSGWLALLPAEPYMWYSPVGVVTGCRERVKNSVAKVEEIMRILTFKNFFLQCLIIFKCQRELEWLLSLRS